MADGLIPSKDKQQKLLQDARVKCDIFAWEKIRVENLLNSTLEKVKLYKTLLGTTKSQLCSVEDLIGHIHFCLQQHGLPTRPMTMATPSPPGSETGSNGAGNSENDRPSKYVLRLALIVSPAYRFESH